MKNITSFTGGALVDNKNNDNIKFNFAHYKKPTKINIIKKIIFLLTLQILNSKILFPIFFKLIKISYKYSFNFFLKKYRTDFEVKIEKKFPSRFKNLMHNFQKYVLLKQFDGMVSDQNSRISKSKFYFDGLKNINKLYFPQKEFNNQNIFLDFPILCKTKETQNSLFQYLLNNKIDVKNYYYTNCSEKIIYNQTDNFSYNSKKISESIIMLPVHEKINTNYQKEIITKIVNFLDNHKK